MEIVSSSCFSWTNLGIRLPEFVDGVKNLPGFALGLLADLECQG